MTRLPDGIYLPRKNRFHWSDYITYKQSPRVYFERFFEGRDNLNTKAIQFGSHLMEVMEFDPKNELVADILRHPHIEYDLECMLGGIIPIETHPDSIDIDNTLGIYEYKTALEHRAWNSRMVYKQKQITFYQMCVRELKGDWNPEENYIVEVPTERISSKEINGVMWQDAGDVKYQEIWRKRIDGGYAPVILHRRVITELELDTLQEDVIATALEVSDHYKKYLENQLDQIN